MMFDAMCRIAERAGIAHLTNRLRYASLVVLGESHLAGWADVKPDATTLFRLPWKATAIEDSMSCVLLERVGQTTMEALSAEVAPHGVRSKLAVGGEVRKDRRVTTADVGLEAGDMFYVAMAQVAETHSVVTSATAVFGGSNENLEHMWAFQGVNLAIEYQGRVSTHSLGMDSKCYWESVRELTNQLIVATWQCVVATQPGSWVLRKVVAKESDGKSPKIPRSHQRPTWIVISDDERRRSFRSDDNQASGAADRHAKAAHPRRAHYRHVGNREDGGRRYTWVRSCWVGSTEARIRGGRYRVEVDL